MRRFGLKIFLYGLVVALSGVLLSAHPFKASVTELNFNDRSGRLELTVKLFTDDLEECVREKTGKLLFLDTKKEIPEAGREIAQYLGSGLVIKLDGKPVEFEFLGKEYESDVTWCYLESGPITFPSEVYVHNSIMTERYPTQSNIVHIQAGKQRKSLLLGPGRLSGSVDFRE